MTYTNLLIIPCKGHQFYSHFLFFSHLGIKKTKEKKEKKEKKMKDIPPPTPNPLVGSISKAGPSAGGGVSETPYPSHSPMPIVSPPLESPKPSKKQEQKSTGLLTETVGPIGHFVVGACILL